MSLRGEVRESVSLDEDDLSDVEDEVFIRDGKRGYKVQLRSIFYTYTLQPSSVRRRTGGQTTPDGPPEENREARSDDAIENQTALQSLLQTLLLHFRRFGHSDWYSNVGGLAPKIYSIFQA